MPRAETPDAEDALKQQEMHSIADFELPKTLVTRIAKAALPDNVKLQKEAVTALVNSSTVFINYLAATAQDVTWARSAKTITAQDVLKALEIIEFEDQVEPMKRELAAFKGAQDPSKSKSRKRPSGAADDSAENPYARPAAAKRKSKAAEPETADGEAAGEDDDEEEVEEEVEDAEEDAGEQEQEGEQEADGDGGASDVDATALAEGAEDDDEMEEDEPPEEDAAMEVEDPGLEEHSEEED